MFITGHGTAAPQQRNTQAQCWDALQNSVRFHELTPRSRAILKKVLTGSNGIATRHLSLDSLADAFDMTPDALHARFIQNAPLLATQAAERAFADAKINPSEIDAIIASTCTGYLCPGLTSYLGQRLGLRKDVMTFDLVGQGCGAALPNLRVADALLAAGRAKRVLSVCVEVCSAAMYLDDDVGVLISACLFGDGAGAAVLSNSPGENRRVEWKASGSMLEPLERDLLRFEQKAGMLRNILMPQVPALAAQHATEEEIAAIGEAYQRMEAAPTPEALLQPDLDFHSRIADATHNDLLAHLCNMLSLALREALKHSNKRPNLHELALPRHKAILTAIENRDALGARHASLVQLDDTRVALDTVMNVLTPL